MRKILLAFAALLCASPAVAQTVHELPVHGVSAMTVGTSYPVRRGVAAVCTAAGNMTVAFTDASTITVPVPVGYSQFSWAITAVTASTGTCSYYSLR